MNINKRFENNSCLENKIYNLLDDCCHINGQNRYPLCEMRYGLSYAGQTACEIIAIYNVLKDIGYNVSLSRLIYYSEKKRLYLLFGLLGTFTHNIKVILKEFNVECEKLKSKNFYKLINNNRIDNNSIYIVTIFNNKKRIISRLHTFEVKYNSNKWIVYNC